MNECDDPDNNPVLMIFNRVLIKYNDDPRDFKSTKDLKQESSIGFSPESTKILLQSNINTN